METRPLLIVTAASLTSLGVGVVLGYKIAEQNLALRFEERMLKETEDMRVYYSQVKKPFATPQEAVENLVSEEDQKEIEEKNAEAVADVLHNVAYHKMARALYNKGEEPEAATDQATSEFQQELIPPAPPQSDDETNGDPHIISQAEFMANESNYQQSTLTYYTEDRVLTDESDDVIEDKQRTIGPGGILSMFGVDSSDPNTVHVRNPALQMEFELVRHQDYYWRVVHGLEAEPTERPSGRKR